MRRACLLSFVALVFVPGIAWPQGNPAGPEFRINTYSTGYQTFPDVASDGSGNFVVVWVSIDQDGSNGGVFGQRYASSGAPAGPEFRVNTYTTNVQKYPAVAADPSGNFVVVWQSFTDSNDIFGQRYAGTGAPLGTEFRINTVTQDFQAWADVTADASGNFVVVWTGLDDVYGQRYASTGGPVGMEFRVNTGTAHAQDVPRLASDASGNIVVVWQSNMQDGLFYDIHAQRFANTGMPVGPEFRVNAYTTYHQLRPTVAADASGNFVIVWMSEQDGDAFGIFGQRYSSSGAPLGPEFRVNTFTTESQGPAAVATDASGNFVVVWRSRYQDGSNDGVFGQRYTNSGAPAGPEFRVSTYTGSDQSYPAVASDAPGNFVVVWRSELQDGFFHDLFGQRYRPMVPVELMGFGVE
jgi:hypothetical protein